MSLFYLILIYFGSIIGNDRVEAKPSFNYIQAKTSDQTHHSETDPNIGSGTWEY